MTAKPSAQCRADYVMNQLGHDLGDAQETIETIITDAIADETNRCLRWLRISPTLDEAVDHIEDYDEPPPEAP